MRYFGGKQRISKPLSEFLNNKLKTNQPFVDLFCGSCNVISKIDSNRPRYANDIHPELIAMWQAVQEGIELPDSISEEEYYIIKNEDVSDWLKGFVGFGCSFAGKWWGGYARGEGDRNYCSNAKRSTIKKARNLGNCQDYREFDIPRQSLVYCDIPYKGTTQYSTGEFDYDDFYYWCISTMIDKDCEILVSEYENNVPILGQIIWQLESKKDIRDRDYNRVVTNEVLFTFEVG